MMIVSPTPVFRWTDNNGNPAVGWQVETYIAGSSTPVDTYTDATGTAENTNPIILDARGEANIWLDPAISYKYVIKDSLGVVQDTIDQIQAGSGGSGGLTRVYYNDSSSIAFSGLGTLATPLSSSIKLSTQPNNALQVRADGLYAMAIGGGGSVAWGSITGNILAQTDLINKFGEYLPLTFASAQTLTYTGESTYQFLSDGRFSVTDIASGNELRLDALNSAVLFKNNTLQVPSGIALRTWELPDASGTIALTSQIPSIPVTSVFGRTGAVTAQSGDYTTAQVTESGNLYFTEARVRSTALTGFSATNSAIVATDSVLVGFNKAQGQINAREPSITAGTTAQYWRGDKTWQTLNTTAVTEGTNLYFTEARVRSSVLTGFSVGANSAIVATDSVLQAFGKTQGQINALVTADGTFIKRDGTSTTTASIPFALGATFSDNQALAWSVGSTIRGTGAGNILVRPWLTSNGGFDVLSYVNTFDATTHNILKWNGTTTPPTGTQAYLLGIDANGRIIQGSGGGSGSFVTISGHNDLTTPWSIGDASTWATSSAGIQIDPVGSYGLHLKGNTIIEQAVSQALSLYRPVASGDVCLNFDAWDSLGAQSSYAQVCGVVVSNTAGSVGGGLDLEVAIAGVLTPLLQLRQAGSTLTGALSVTDALTGTSATFSSSVSSPTIFTYATNGVGDIIINNSANTINRWIIRKQNNETGSNTGSDLQILARDDAGSVIDAPIQITRAAGGNIAITRPIVLPSTGANISGVGVLNFAGTASAYNTSVDRGIIYATNNTGAAYPFLEIGNLIISPRISGASRDVIISTLGTKADLTVDRSGNTSVAGTLTASGLVSTPASTTSSAGLRIPHGTAPTSPVNGDLWTTTTAVLARINGTTRTFGLLGVANDWSTTQTARAWLTTVQTSTPTGTTYTWTITSGAQLELNLGSSTGNVTITTSLAVSATCVLSVVGHATLSRDVTITQSGVTFIMGGKTSGVSITLDSIPATKRACYTLYFITSTKCFIDRIVLEA